MPGSASTPVPSCASRRMPAPSRCPTSQPSSNASGSRARNGRRNWWSSTTSRARLPARSARSTCATTCAQTPDENVRDNRSGTTMTADVYRSIDVAPLAGAIGAEITGVDLATDLPDDTVAEIRRAWLRHLVVFFRDQALGPDAFLSFARRIGE